MNIEPWGDTGILVSLDDQPSSELTERLAGIAKAAREMANVVDAAPGYTKVLIEVSPEHHKEVMAAVPVIAERAVPISGRLVEIALTYDGEDIEWSCNHLNMTLDELVEVHSGQIYDVRLLGSPGFIYLSDVSAKLALPRLDRPRMEVAAGTVGIGGRQTGIYGRARPGGWRLIGRVTEVANLRPGDRVRFVPS